MTNPLSVRAGLGSRDMKQLEQAVDQHGPSAETLRRTLREHGPDALLRHPDFDASRLESPGLELLLYATISRACAEAEIDTETTDCVAAVAAHFAKGRRAYWIDPHGEYEAAYLCDVLQAAEAGKHEAARHLGDFALWSAGFFPERVLGRWRRGGPSLGYYDAMGSMGYRRTATDAAIRRRGLDTLFHGLADRFSTLRRALNDVTDRLVLSSPDPVERLLRQVAPP